MINPYGGRTRFSFFVQIQHCKTCMVQRATVQLVQLSGEGLHGGWRAAHRMCGGAAGTGWRGAHTHIHTYTPLASGGAEVGQAAIASVPRLPQGGAVIN